MYSEYQDSIDEAAQIARSAIPLAAKLNLPINPIIYAVCYQHVAQVNNELSQLFESLLENKKDLSKEDIEELYQTHIYQTDAKSLEILRLAVQSIIQSTTGAIGKVEDKSKIYGEQLGSVSQKLQEDRNLESIETVITTLIRETESMHLASKKLHEELTQANTKIDQMHLEFNRIRHESLTDPLTGLKNRRAFDRDIEELCKKAKQDNMPLSLLMIDIDHFKKINDNHGHILGDSVLKWVAQLIRESVRGNDRPARFGGEEFVLLLPETTLDGAKSVAENIRNNIAKRNIRNANTVIGRTTVSIGAAQFKVNESSESLISRSDQALYRAKESGRNCVQHEN